LYQRILSDEEIEALYGQPRFSPEERAGHFALSPLENKASPFTAMAGCFPCPCEAAGAGRIPVRESARRNEAA